MTTQTFIRWSANTLIAIALLSFAYALLGPNENMAGVFSHPNYVIANVFNLLRQGLLALGVIGFVLSMRGTLAKIGFVITFFGAIIVAGLDVDKTFILPYLASVNPTVTHVGNFAQNAPAMLQNFLLVFMIGLLLYFVGPILLGIAVIKSDTLPSWAGILMIVGNVMQYGNMFGVPYAHTIGVAVFGAALGWLGFALRSTQTNEVIPSMQAQPAK